MERPLALVGLLCLLRLCALLHLFLLSMVAAPSMALCLCTLMALLIYILALPAVFLPRPTPPFPPSSSLMTMMRHALSAHVPVPLAWLVVLLRPIFLLLIRPLLAPLLLLLPLPSLLARATRGVLANRWRTPCTV